MKIIMHGAGQEVGRSCIEIQVNEKRYILDAGLKIRSSGTEAPTYLENASSITAAFVSHIHLDHTGVLPKLYAEGLKCPIYTGPLTKELLPILLQDSWKVSILEKMPKTYEKNDIQSVLRNMNVWKENTNKQSEFSVPGASIKTFDAGHVPGARSIFLDFGDRNVLYTGDFNYVETLLTHKADIESYPKNIDTLIIETTYANEDHVPREQTIAEFKANVLQTLDQGGHVLIPTFSVGRAQEILMLLHEKPFSDYPIFFDGMAKKIADVFLKHPNLVRNHAKLKEAFRGVTVIKKHFEREKAIKKQSIVITTAGMLDGGPVLYYLPFIAKDKNSSVLLTGYQADESNGRLLLDNRYVIVDGREVDVLCFVKKYDFSGHAGKTYIQKVINDTNPKNVILNHGDKKKMEFLFYYLQKENKRKVYMPATGDSVEL